LDWGGAEEVQQGKLMVMVPATAVIFVDGVERGTGPQQITLSYGGHTIYIEINGQKSAQQELNIDSPFKSIPLSL
jgi:hypothetical protein